MSGFKLGGMTLGSVFKKPETLLYPFEQKQAPAGLRGSVGIIPEKCILCGICQKGCPCSCITVDKKTRTWTTDPFACVRCGACVRACPKSCLVMDVTYTKPATGMASVVVEVPDAKAAPDAPEGE